jgi:isoleucyl-tRNA synthetase
VSVTRETLRSVSSTDNNYWNCMLDIRGAVSKKIQDCRDKKIIGSSLDAQVDFYADSHNRMLLSRLEDELHFWFIVSITNVYSDLDIPEDAQETEITGLYTVISFSPHPKCARCYHRRKDVDLDKKYPGICYRCIDNITGVGEVRKYI